MNQKTQTNRQLLISRVTGQVLLAEIHMSGKRVYQALENSSNMALLCRFEHH